MLDYKAIGRKIAYYRKLNRFTQSVVAEALDVSEGYLSQIECGKAEISLKRLDQIAEILNIEIGLLLSDTSINAKCYGASELLELTKHWSPEQKNMLITFVKFADEHYISARKK